MNKIKIFGFTYKTKYRVLFAFFVLFVAINMCTIVGYPLLMNCYKATCYVANTLSPSDRVFSNYSGVYYVNGGKQTYTLTDELPSLFLPTATYYKIDNGIMTFDTSENIILRASGDGIVKKVGFKDNAKFIEIRHSGNIFTRYENVNIVGVISSSLVKQGEIIATLKPDEKFTFRVLKDNEIITNYTIENGKLVWQS